MNSQIEEKPQGGEDLAEYNHIGKQENVVEMMARKQDEESVMAKRTKTDELTDTATVIEGQMVTFELLPNELLSYILLVHLEPIWHFVCKVVCRQWHVLLAQSTVPLPCTASFTTAVVVGGHLEVLQWARSQGCPWDEDTCAHAARGGHLEVLEWAREQGCPWDEWTCAYAARGGHLEVLKWARSHGCMWDEWTCIEAARGGHLEVLEWARSHGCPWNGDSQECS